MEKLIFKNLGYVEQRNNSLTKGFYKYDCRNCEVSCGRPEQRQKSSVCLFQELLVCLHISYYMHCLTTFLEAFSPPACEGLNIITEFFFFE